MYKILAINPGSTSTKIAGYEDENLLFTESISHSAEELEKYPTINDQFAMRYESIMDVLSEKNLDIKKVDCVVGRGGPVAPLQSGAYVLDEHLADKYMNNPMSQHASNLGGLIAYKISKEHNMPAYIYDAVSTDELDDIARISGLKEIERKSLVHTLNMKAAGLEFAKEENREYKDMNLIIAHLGGGLSISLHKKGRMVEIVSDDEGAFSPERSGGLPARSLIKMCYTDNNDYPTMYKHLRGKGGLVSYLGTNDAREVEKMIADGNEYAREIYEAMAYQISKGIGELAPVVDGQIDGVIITGGMAYSKMLTDWIVKRVSYLGKVKIIAGENELKSLAMGGLRVLKGIEKAHTFVD